MTPRDRINAVLNRKATDRLPCDLWHTPEVGAALRQHTGTATDLEMWRALDLDKIVWVSPEYRTDSGQATAAQPGAGQVVARTLWGAALRGIETTTGHYDEVAAPPMSGYDTPADVDRYPFWPSADRWDYAAAVARAKEAAALGFSVNGPWVSFLEIYCQLRGLEQAMMDLALNEPLVDATLDRLETIQTEMLRRYLAAARDHLTMVFVSDDLGSQTGLLISPAMWRRHLQPRMRRWCDLIHSFGLKVFFHTDGASEPLIAPLIECGIDILNPIQHICPGMETAALKRNYGRDLIFHGGVDNQHVLPFGTPADVRAEVQMLRNTLGSDGRGFICCSCHNVQAGTPVENILAMIAEAHAVE